MDIIARLEELVSSDDYQKVLTSDLDIANLDLQGSDESVNELIDLLDSVYDSFKGISNINSVLRKNSHLKLDKITDANLAVRIHGHDLYDTEVAILNHAENFDNWRKRYDEGRISKEKTNNYQNRAKPDLISLIPHAKCALDSIAHLGLGLGTQVSITHLDNLDKIFLRGIKKGIENVISIDISSEIDTIPSDFYWTMFQLTKNAHEMNWHDLVSGNRNIKVRVEKTSSGLISKIRDYRNGISKDVLPKIFGSYSGREYGSGLGLQVVDRLVNLTGGNIIVTSTTPDNMTWTYDRNKDSLYHLNQEDPGTTFEVFYNQ